MDLFGTEVTVSDPPRGSKRPPINDMELVTSVLRTASNTGFVLSGTREQVRRRVTDEQVERVPTEVDHAVRQLIEAGWLTLGGRKQVRCGSQWTAARSVLVPKQSRQTLARWESLCNPWKHTNKKGA